MIISGFYEMFYDFIINQIKKHSRCPDKTFTCAFFKTLKLCLSFITNLTLATLSGIHLRGKSTSLLKEVFLSLKGVSFYNYHCNQFNQSFYPSVEKLAKAKNQNISKRKIQIIDLKAKTAAQETRSSKLAFSFQAQNVSHLNVHENTLHVVLVTMRTNHVMLYTLCTENNKS